MAQQTDKRRPVFQVQGSAAVEPAYYPQREEQTVPAPRQSPRKAPKPRKRPAARPAQRQVMAVSPTAVLGTLLCAMMLVLVLVGYARVFESQKALGEMEDQVAQLQADNRELHNLYDSSIDLEVIEARAKELGMQQPSGNQMITLSICAEDTAVVRAKESFNPLRAAGNAIWETLEDLAAYLGLR